MASCFLIALNSSKLLIAPIWNRNLAMAMGGWYFLIPFNRTNLESKQASEAILCRHLNAFNRTNLESKRMLATPYLSYCTTFNRTNLESKRSCHHRVLYHLELLIAPIWNRNRKSEKMKSCLI